MSFTLGSLGFPVANEVFPFFSSAFSLFIIVFFIVIVLAVLMFIINFWRTIRSGATQEQTYSAPVQPPAAPVEKEIIREIVKIRCSYCGNLYDENQEKCLYCGAKR